MNQNYNLIEPFLDDELSLAEKNNFIAELEKDESLRRAVAEEKATRATLYLMMTNRFSERAKSEGASESEGAKIVAMPQQNAWRKWAIAAAVFGLILTAGIYLNSSKSTDYTALSAKYTYDYPTPQVQVAATEKQVSDAFYTAIKSQNFDAALSQYQQLSAAMQQEPNIAFFHAFVLLKKVQNQAALTAFQGIANPPDELREPIEWYSLMAQLADKQNITTKLKAIAGDGKHSYQAKAKALLEEL
jgi:hypothetical protein